MSEVKSIVSITPLQLSGDTRAFKIAASFARFGFRSIVVEGQNSHLNQAELPFELSAVEESLLGGGKSKSAISNMRRKRPRFFKQKLKQRMHTFPPFLQRGLTALASPSWYLNRFFLPLMDNLPAASLYYLHAPHQFLALRWEIMKRATPFIYDAHDFYPSVNPSAFYEWLERWCIKKATAVVTVSDGIAQLMKDEFVCKATVLRNCHDKRLEKTPTAGLREILGLSSDTFLLVVIGQIKPGQAVKEALEALKSLPGNVHLAFVGKRTEEHECLVMNNRLELRVHLLPAVRQDEVVPFMKSADAALILYYPLSPNYQNCLPNGFFQAVAARLPLIYPELPEIKKLAEKYNLGVSINPQVPDSIRAGVMQLLKEPSMCRRFKENADQARMALSWEREEKILYNLVTSIIGRAAEED